MTASVAIVITLPLSEPFGTESERNVVYEFEDALSLALAEASAGDVDGHGFGDDTAEIFIFTTDSVVSVAIVEGLAREMGLTTTISVGGG